MMSKKTLKNEVKALFKNADKVRKKGQSLINFADHLEQTAWDLQESALKERGFKIESDDDGDTLLLKKGGKVLESAGGWAGSEYWLMDRALERADLA